jgi:glycosyltransferase involved in cell wall biosynthesis
MRILIVHNRYQQPGGEDVVVSSEADLLESHGHTVAMETFDNSEIPESRSPLQSVKLAATTVWSTSAKRRIRRAIRRFCPDIVHFHNTFPLVSPAAYGVCQAERVPVVQTLHNYRLLCANAFLLRDAHVCTDCLGHIVTWPGIRHACYRDSRLMSGTISAMQLVHRLVANRRQQVDAYIALSESSRSWFVRGGFPSDAIFVKPNFVTPDPGPGAHQGGFVLFVGRLSLEKGLRTLLRAWQRLDVALPLRIVGDGPLASEVKDVVHRNPLVSWLGPRQRAEVIEIMGSAALLVFPSEWQETFGLAVIEAYARGTPVLASNLGAPLEVVRDGYSGLHFKAGDADDLARRVRYLFDRPELLTRFGRNARELYVEKYSAERNYRQLLAIYEAARVRSAKRHHRNEEPPR